MKAALTIVLAILFLFGVMVAGTLLIPAFAPLAGPDAPLPTNAAAAVASVRCVGVFNFGCNANADATQTAPATTPALPPMSGLLLAIAFLIALVFVMAIIAAVVLLFVPYFQAQQRRGEA